MAKPELLISIHTLSKKVDLLLQEQNKLLERIKLLEIENDKLKNQSFKDREALENAEKDIEFLSLSHRLANSPEALTKARQKIAKLIRTIDSCIRLINED